jgi:hypothetical protein
MRTKFSMIFLKNFISNSFYSGSCAINLEFTLFIFSCVKAFISVRLKLNKSRCFIDHKEDPYLGSITRFS